MSHFDPIVQDKYGDGFRNMRLDSRAHYYVLFKYKNPIAWLLIYRRLMLAKLTDEERKIFFEYVSKVYTFQSAHTDMLTCWEDELAFYRPYFFLLRLFSQFFIKRLTTAGKIIPWFQRPILDSGRVSNADIPSDEVTHNSSVDHELTHEQHQVPGH